MELINYISLIAVPFVIGVIIFYGMKDKIKVFDVFVYGAKDGIRIIIDIFPTLLGLFVAIGCLRASGIIDLIIKFIDPILSILKMPSEIIPLALLRPVSGSSAIAIATDIMTKYGVDSKIGLIASVIMGSTETTIYTIAVYTAGLKIKKNKQVLFIALLGDFVGIVTSIIICNIFFI